MRAKGPTERVHDALAVVEEYGQPDGAHHLRWIVDQMVRALCGGGRSPAATPEYREWVTAFRDGDDGPDTYDWDEGTAP